MTRPDDGGDTVPVRGRVGETSYPTLHVLLGGKRVGRAVSNGDQRIQSDSPVEDGDGRKDECPVAQTLFERGAC